MLCLTLRISSGYRSLIYPCTTIKIGGHRRLTQSTHEICRPTYNCSQTKRPFAILILQNFDTFNNWPFLEPNSAAAYQISLKLDDLQLRYSDETIFKIGNLVTWPVSERNSASSYQISRLLDNKSLRCSQKTIFNMVDVRHFEFSKFWYFVTWPSLEPKSKVAHQISLKSDDPRLRYSDETIFKMAAVCHLEFSKIAIFVMTCVWAWFYVCMPNTTSIGQ